MMVKTTMLLKAPMSGLGLGRVKTALAMSPWQSAQVVSQATIAAISGLIPTMFITRVRL
jgi:hypothetical protein